MDRIDWRASMVASVERLLAEGLEVTGDPVKAIEYARANTCCAAKLFVEIVENYERYRLL